MIAKYIKPFQAIKQGIKLNLYKHNLLYYNLELLLMKEKFVQERYLHFQNIFDR